MPRVKSSEPGPSRGRKPTLSPTRFQTYLDCAVKYRYIYIDKIGRFYLRSRPYYSFGSSLHNVLKLYHTQGESHTAEELAEALESGWIDAGYTTETEAMQHLEAGRQIVEAYHAADQDRAAGAVETVATEKTISWDMGPFRLAGRVDRIDRHADGLLEIVDYKSGRMEVTPEEVAADMAMSCYQLILKRLHPESDVTATIYCLRSGGRATCALSSEDLLVFEQDIRTLGEEILNRDFAPLLPVPVESCPECDFLPRCERFWRSVKRADDSDERFSDQGL